MNGNYFSGWNNTLFFHGVQLNAVPRFSCMIACNMFFNLRAELFRSRITYTGNQFMSRNPFIPDCQHEHLNVVSMLADLNQSHKTTLVSPSAFQA